MIHIPERISLICSIPLQHVFFFFFYRFVLRENSDYRDVNQSSILNITKTHKKVKIKLLLLNIYFF
jgi:hypothetical protein